MLNFRHSVLTFRYSSYILELGGYGSLSEFCKKIDLPWTTLDSILKRGVDKANIRNILKITSELRIDVECLANGEIVYKEDSQ